MSAKQMNGNAHLLLRRGRHVSASACHLMAEPMRPVYIGIGKIRVAVPAIGTTATPEWVATMLQDFLGIPMIAELENGTSGSLYRLDLEVFDYRPISRWLYLGWGTGSPLDLVLFPVFALIHVGFGFGTAKLRLNARLSDDTGQVIAEIEDRQRFPSNRYNEPLPWTKEGRALRALLPNEAELQILLKQAAASLTMELGHLLRRKGDQAT